MITVLEAENIIAQNSPIFKIEEVPLEEAVGRVLREDITADRDDPPEDKVLMDGFAINVSRFQEGVREFLIEATQPAGTAPTALKRQEGCIEIMTGALLPKGCDGVIPIEDVQVEDNRVSVVSDRMIEKMQNILPRGKNHKQGTILVSEGARLSPPRIAAAASAGRTKIKVTALPSVAIIGSGDELVDIGKALASHQVRKSNSYALGAALRQAGIKDIEMFHMRDDKKEMTDILKKVLVKFDILILSGGVSMGKFDYVPAVLKELGVEVLFHKVQQRPGKPFWFGKTKEGRTVFALPGNPVSTQICCYRYIIPQIKRSLGVDYVKREYAVLGKPFDTKTDLTYFLPVRIESALDGKCAATPVVTSGSSDFATLARSDGFVELSANTRQFPKYFVAPLYRWGA